MVSRYKMIYTDREKVSFGISLRLHLLFSWLQCVGCRIVSPWHKFRYLFSLRQVEVFWEMGFIVTWLKRESFLTSLLESIPTVYPIPQVNTSVAFCLIRTVDQQTTLNGKQINAFCLKQPLYSSISSFLKELHATRV